MTSSRASRAVSALLVSAALLAVAAVFAFGIPCGFVGIDDSLYTSGCPFVRNGLSWENVLRAFCDIEYGGIWMPVTFVSYMVDATLFGDFPAAYHAVNVLLHVLNAFLVYLFLKDLSASRDDGVSSFAASAACLAGAALWALHPLRAEGVAYVAARKELLWTTFGLLSLMQYGRFLEGRRIVRYVAALACCALALCSKPTAVAVPFLALALHWYRRDRAKVRLTWLLPMFALAAAGAAVTLQSQTDPTGTGAPGVLVESFSWRILNAAVSLGLYLWYTVVPTGIHFDYRAVFGGWPVNGWLGLGTLAVVFALAAWAAYRSERRTREAMVFAGLVFLLSVGPVLGVFAYVNSDQAMADRYAYFPEIALAFLFAHVVRRTSAGSAGRVAVLVVAVALAEAVLAVPVVRSFDSAYTAYARVLERDPDHWRALRVVGNEYCARQGRMDEGIAMLKRSLELRGSQMTADSLAYLLAFRGAKGDFEEVRRLGGPVAANPRLDASGMMLDALGVVAMREGDWMAAARYFGEGLTVPKRNHSPDYSLLYLGECLANAGRDADATAVLGKAAKSADKGVRDRAAAAIRAIAAPPPRPLFRWR